MNVLRTALIASTAALTLIAGAAFAGEHHDAYSDPYTYPTETGSMYSASMQPSMQPSMPSARADSCFVDQTMTDGMGHAHKTRTDICAN